MVLIAIKRTQTEKRSEKPKIRLRRRVVGAVNPVRTNGQIDERRRNRTMRSSQNVKELDKNVKVCRMRGTERVFIMSLENILGVGTTRTRHETKAAAKRLQSNQSMPGTLDANAK